MKFSSLIKSSRNGEKNNLKHTSAAESNEMAPAPRASRPMQANYPSEHLTIAAGVAIFHVASERVVVCYHTRDEYWFLPKGRRNANEETGRAGEREGYEESGYLNRLLPIPLLHRQPDADAGHERYVTEPVWTQLLPLSERTQYLLFWYVAETIPPAMERLYIERGFVERGKWETPTSFPAKGTLSERIQEEMPGYEPVRHEGTGVDEEEALYTAELMPMEEACEKLRGSIMEDVVRRGWAAIQLRFRMEAQTP